MIGFISPQHSTIWELFPFFFFFFFLKIGYFIYFSNVIPFPGSPSGSPLFHPLSPCFYEGALSPTHFCLLILAFPYSGALSLHRAKGLSSHWWPPRPSSATCAAGPMGPTMCTKKFSFFFTAYLPLVSSYTSWSLLLVGSYLHIIIIAKAPA